jgi:esterase FrsA
MNLDEMKEFVGLHAKSQRIGGGEFRDVLNRIHEPAGDGEGAWAYEWSRFGEDCLRRRRYDRAVQCFNFARFPYVDSAARQAALDRCIETFRAHRVDDRRIRRDAVRVRGLDVPVYASISSKPLPLLIVIGGIVSIKEQWHKMLGAGRKLGYSVVVTECPGVGENPMRYDADSAALIGAIIDHYRARVEEDNVMIVGLSFGGHLAMRAALHDKRIKRIATAGAPVNRFFTDESWWTRVPQITKQTLAHIAQVGEAGLPRVMGGLALNVDDLRKLSVPVMYIMSLRDEIIPPDERHFLVQGLARLDLMEFDDVHGAPSFLPAVRQLIFRELARHNNVGYGLLERILNLSIGLTNRRRGARRYISTNIRVEGV